MSTDPGSLRFLAGQDAGDPSDEGKPITEEVGVLGLDIQGGWVRDDPLTSFHDSITRAQTFREMATNDATVGAMLFAIENLISQVEWTVKPAVKEEGDVPSRASEEAAQFLRECMDDMACTWGEFIGDVLSMLPYGYSVLEETYKVRRGAQREEDRSSKFDDDRIGWAKFGHRAQETLLRWFVRTDGTVDGVQQLGPPDYVIHNIPATRFLHFRAKSHRGNPEGYSILRNAYRAWFYKKRIEEIEAIGVERDLAGIPVMHVPPEIMRTDASSAEVQLREQLQTLVRSVHRNEKSGLVIPRSYDENGNPRFEFSLLSTGGTRQIDTNAIINRYDRRIAQVILADFIFLGQDKVGSFALVSSKTQLFATAIGGWLDAICQVLNRVAVQRLFAKNVFDVSDGLPEICHGDVETEELDKFSNFVSQMISAGAILPDDPLEAALRERGDLPPIVEDDPRRERRLMTPPTPPGGGPPPPPGAGGQPGQPPPGADAEAGDQDDVDEAEEDTDE